jgi:hypothetical protein
MFPILFFDGQLCPASFPCSQSITQHWNGYQVVTTPRPYAAVTRKYFLSTSSVPVPSSVLRAQKGNEKRSKMSEKRQSRQRESDNGVE